MPPVSPSMTGGAKRQGSGWPDPAWAPLVVTVGCFRGVSASVLALDSGTIRNAVVIPEADLLSSQGVRAVYPCLGRLLWIRSRRATKADRLPPVGSVVGAATLTGKSRNARAITPRRVRFLPILVEEGEGDQYHTQTDERYENND
jgi:hypothetical protein